MSTSTPPTDPPKLPWWGKLPPWFYGTRALGTVMILYGIFGDHTPERGTIILTGAGLLGFDKVARSDKDGKDK